MPSKTPSKRASRIPPKWRKPILAVAVVCAAAVMLVGARQPSPAEDQPNVPEDQPGVETSIVAVQPEAPAAAPASRPPAPRTDTRAPAAAQPAARPANTASRPAPTAARPVNAAAAPKPESVDRDVRPAAAPAASAGSRAELATRPAADAPAPTPPVESVSTAAMQDAASTITGCLERADSQFRLRDTEGEDAPRARSWRSGFIRRSNARVAIVDPTNDLQLSTHVGHRVSVTGTLVDREMQARSVTMVADSCDD